MLKCTPLVLSSVVALTVSVCGCSSTRLELEIDPPDVQMKNVTADGVAALRGSSGKYVVNVSVPKDSQVATVTVKAQTVGGVSVEKNYTVARDGPSTEVLRVPAELLVAVIPPSTRAEVVVGDRAFSSGDTPIDVPANKTVEVAARNLDTGVTAKTQVTVKAGERQRIELKPVLAARMSISKSPVAYEEAVEFNGAGSSPAGNIAAFLWDFGDGRKHETVEPVIRHAYRFDPEQPTEERSYTVALQVRTLDGKLSQSETATVTARLPATKLEFEAELYSRDSSPCPGKPVQLKLVPKDAAAADMATELTLHFGESDQTTAVPVKLERVNGQYLPILLTHTYQEAGRYVPKLTYRPTRPKGAQTLTAELAADGVPLSVTVVEPYLTAQALKEAAWLDLFLQLTAVLQDANITKDKRLALTSFTSANFEYDEPQFAPVCERLTRLFVSNDYCIMEKNSQVLVRLAPEAVVDIRPELIDGGANAREHGYVYREQLEYGLAPYHLNAKQPILYSVEMAGTDDRVSLFESYGGERVDAEAQRRMSASNDTATVTHSGEKTNTQRDRELFQLQPLLIARFQTADHLIAIKIIDAERVETVGPVLFDAAMNEPVFERRASVKAHIRVLSRTGRILRAVDLVGTHIQPVPKSALSSLGDN